MPNSEHTQTFWDHLDELRSCLIRMIVAVLVCGIVAFCFKDLLFKIILAPKEASFVTFKLIERLTGRTSDFSLTLINIDLAQQFIIHLKVAFYFGLLCVSPYLLYELFKFVAPALYTSERKYAVTALVGGCVMFFAGVLLNYFIIYPVTVRFLGSYQVSAAVPNIISLESYISALLMLSLTLGILFEIPILCWLLAKFGLLTEAPMKKYRRHAIVVILIVAAIITPTADAFTLTIVALPIYLLYEISIVIVRKTAKAYGLQQ